MRGIDVSRYQTVTSWRSVAAAGYRFAVVKATEGTDYTSPTFHDYYHDLRAAGLLAGSYHLARPASSDAASQAAAYVRQLRAVGFRSGRDLPPNLDIEDTGGMSKAALTRWCQSFCHEVDRLLDLTGPWLRCGFYCNRDYYTHRLDGPALHQGRWWWLALWPAGQKQPHENEMPAGAAIWQWTDDGRVPGVQENTDLDVAREQDLHNLAPAFYGEDDMPTFRHFGLGDAVPIPAAEHGKPRPWALDFHVEWADPAPASHAEGASSYVRASDGWSSHELTGVRVTGMKPGDNYQVQLIVVAPDAEEVVWSAVLSEALATSGNEYFSVARSLHSRKGQRVRWRFIYRGAESDVKVTRAEWVIKEY